MAMAIAVFGFFTFFSVMSSGSHHAAQTRNRALAQALAENLIEDILAHTYGDPAPRRWTRDTDYPAQLWIEGRQQQVVFHKHIDFATGSFVSGGASGAPAEDTPEVPTPTVTPPPPGRPPFGCTRGAHAAARSRPVSKSYNTQDNDLVIITITWKEGVGDNEVVGNPTGYPEDNKMLRVEVPVWR